MCSRRIAWPAASISRTSSFCFQGQRNDPLPEIAKQLGVRHILEGSIRQQWGQIFKSRRS